MKNIDVAPLAYYNVLQKEAIAMTVSVRLNEEDSTLFRDYAALHGISLSELIRRSVLEHIEDEYDMRCYKRAMQEYRQHPEETYSLEEMEKELGLA